VFITSGIKLVQNKGVANKKDNEKSMNDIPTKISVNLTVNDNKTDIKIEASRWLKTIF
jgi:hypothetical protein